MKWEHLLEGISVIDSVCWHDYPTSHCGQGRLLKDSGLETGLVWVNILLSGLYSQILSVEKHKK